MQKSIPIFPIILAAGPAPRLGYPHALAELGGRTALAIAVENCLRAKLKAPIVVLGSQSVRVRATVPRGARVVTNQWWKRGMLTSIRAGLRRVPPGGAFLLYPVDLPLLTPAILRQVVWAFRQRKTGQSIVSPVHRGRLGHPVIFAPEVRRELDYVCTARELVEKDPQRVVLVKVKSPAIYTDFRTPADVRRLQRKFAQGTSRGAR